MENSLFKNFFTFFIFKKMSIPNSFSSVRINEFLNSIHLLAIFFRILNEILILSIETAIHSLSKYYKWFRYLDKHNFTIVL